MRCMTRNFTIAALSIFIALVLSFAAGATPITFIHNGSGSGLLNGTNFSGNFIITATGDTDDISNYKTSAGSNIYSLEHLTTFIEIENLGIFDFSTPTRTWVNNNVAQVGFSLSNTLPYPYDGIDLFQGAVNSGFSSWNMLLSIGPVTGSGLLLQWDDFININTSGGVLEFLDGSTTATFRAVVGGSAVPEPTSIVLLGIGLLGIAGLGHKRMK